MNDLNNLSKEELIALLLKTQKENKSKDSEIEKLKLDNYDLRIQIEDLIAKYESKLEASKKFQVEKFIPTSEKLKDEDFIINEIEVIKGKKKYKKPTERFIEELKSLCNEEDDIIIDYDFKDMDTSKVKAFGEDINYKIEYNPSSFKVVKVIRKKYKDKDHIYQTLSDDPFPHSPLTPSLAANLIEMKFNLGIPFYRYSNYLKANGLNISDIDICNYASRCTKLLEPLYDKLLDNLINNDTKVLHIDETPLKVIDSDKSKCYMFVYATSFYDYPIYIYDFNESRKTDKTESLLKDYKGYIITDGYAGYDKFDNGDIKIQRCMVHARRYFNDVLKVLSDDLKAKSPAYTVIKLMSKLFDDERKFKTNKYKASRIREERNSKRYKGYIKELDDYINNIDTTNNDLLYKAVNYYKNHKDELYTYLDNGFVDMSNNLAERVVKPFVVARKNFMFCKTVDGATTTAKLFSIVQTARANGLKSEKYLTYVLSNINKKDINDLLPWSNKLPKDLLITNKDI